MDRAEILAAAQRCVCGERQQDYGTPENSFRVIGELWETYIKEKCASVGAQIEIIPEDVAALPKTQNAKTTSVQSKTASPRMAEQWAGVSRKETAK